MREMSAEPKRALNEEGYLALEREAETKSEFCNGEMLAMAGVRIPHNKVAFNLSVAIGRRLGDSCSGYTENGAIYYPDVVFTCGQAQCLDSLDDVLLNPILIIEVISPSTTKRDRGVKQTNYQTIQSLKAYPLVSREKVQVEVQLRDADAWTTTLYTSLEDNIELKPLETQIPLAEVYRRVF